jgi:hypothetical protein
VDSRSRPRFRGARLPARYRGAGEPSGTSRPTWPRCAPRRGPWAGPGERASGTLRSPDHFGSTQRALLAKANGAGHRTIAAGLDRPGINRAPLAPRRPRRPCRVAVSSSTPDSTPDVLRHLCPGGALSPRPCCRSPRRTVRRSSCPSPRDRSRRGPGARRWLMASARRARYSWRRERCACSISRCPAGRICDDGRPGMDAPIAGASRSRCAPSTSHRHGRGRVQNHSPVLFVASIRAQ